jgi:hypothetical protein
MGADPEGVATVKLVCSPPFSEVDLVASAEELSRLAGAVADGEGALSSTASSGSNDLAGVVVRKTSGPGVLIRLNPERQILVISGDSAGRAVLADNLLGMASAEDGGHLHVDYFPGHFYLAEGSLSLVINSPHGGMPTH